MRIAEANRRALWKKALVLPGQPDLRTSLVSELAEYLGQPYEQVETRCRNAASALVKRWQAASPATGEQVLDFYRQADDYLYDLTWWHTLVEDDSALVQVEALEAARSLRLHSALDFGCGIGSLGLALAVNGLQVTLADVNSTLLDFARFRFERRGLPAHFIDLSTGTALHGETFEFIAAVDVLEHIPDPLPALEDMASALQPGGILFIHLPASADAAHPMHLWSQPGTVLRHVEPLGLQPIHTRSALILRKGQAPLYARRPGFKLVPQGEGGFLLSERPLYAFRLNRGAYHALKCLDAPLTSAQVAAQTGLPPEQVPGFLDGFVQKEFLTRLPPAPLKLPTISVILPARNRPDETRRCIESLLALDYPADHVEVLLVDDASDPPLAPALEGLPVQVIRLDKNVGQSKARNIAATLAKGDLLAFIDNDCLAEPGWLRTLVPYLDEIRTGLVGGKVLAAPASGAVAAFESVRSPLDMGDKGGEIGPGRRVAYLPTCNLLVRRDVFEQAGGFDEGMFVGEDVDFIWRALQMGSRAFYAPEGRVIHRHRVRLLPLLRRRADYGSSEAILSGKHPAGRRVMSLPLTSLLLLFALAFWPVSLLTAGVLAGASGLSFAIEVLRKSARMRSVGLDYSPGKLVLAVGREHASAFYHLSAACVRYYGLLLIMAGVIWPAAWLPVLLMLLFAPLFDYANTRPRIFPLTYLALYLLEMAAYQTGVWAGCVQHRNFTPLVPVIKIRR